MRKTVTLFVVIFLSFTALFSITIDFETALKFYEEGDYTNAYPIFFQLFNKEPSSKIGFYLGNIAYLQNNFEEAWYWYEKSIDSFPNENLLFNAGVTLIKLGRYKDAIRLFEKIENKTPLIYLVLSMLYYNTGSYDIAAKSIENIIKTSVVLPDNFFLNVYRIYFYSLLKEKKYEKSIKTSFLLERLDKSEIFLLNNSFLNFIRGNYSKVFSLLSNIENDKAFLILALIYIDKQDFAKALYNLEKIKNPNDEVAKIKAYCFYKSGFIQNAYELISNAKLNKPEDYILKSVILYQAGKQEEAKKTLEIKFFSNLDMKTLLNLLSLYINLKEYDKGFFLLARFIENFNDYELKIYAFNLLLIQEKYEDAFKYGLEILNKEKETEYDYIFLYNMGKLYERKNEIVKAEELYKKSIMLKPDFVYPYIALGGVYTIKKDYNSAIDSYLVVINLLPDNPYYYYLLAQVFVLSGDLFLAKKYILTALEKGLDKSYIINDPLFSAIKLD